MRRGQRAALKTSLYHRASNVVPVGVLFEQERALVRSNRLQANKEVAVLVVSAAMPGGVQQTARGREAGREGGQRLISRFCLHTARVVLGHKTCTCRMTIAP